MRFIQQYNNIIQGYKICKSHIFKQIPSLRRLCSKDQILKLLMISIKFLRKFGTANLKKLMHMNHSRTILT